MSQQQAQRPGGRPALVITIGDRSGTYAEWAERSGLSIHAIRKRHQNGVRGEALIAPEAARSPKRTPAPTNSPANEVRAVLTAFEPVDLLRRLGWDVDDLGDVPNGQLVVIKAVRS